MMPAYGLDVARGAADARSAISWPAPDRPAWRRRLARCGKRPGPGPSRRTSARSREISAAACQA